MERDGLQNSRINTMCMANAYWKRGSEKELILEDVAAIECEGDHLRLKALFGEEISIEGKIKEIDFLSSRIMLERSPKKERKRK
jgi:predicted RNA-binding protein